MAKSSLASGGSRSNGSVVIPPNVNPHDAIRSVLASMPKIRLVREGQGFIELASDTSWMSWGTNYAVRFFDEPEGTRVRIAASPALPTQLIDFGEARKNVDALLRGVLRFAGAEPH